MFLDSSIVLITVMEEWDGENLAFETNANGIVTNTYDYGLDMIRESKSKNRQGDGDIVLNTEIK